LTRGEEGGEVSAASPLPRSLTAHPPSTPSDSRQTLQAGAKQLGLLLLPGQIDALLAYLALIEKWNKVYNLTALRDPQSMLTHHLLDSLAVVVPLRQRLAAMAYGMDGAEELRTGPLFHLLDVGSGAGLPGIVIAICCPEVTVDCVDTVAKKAAFINQVAVTLKLSNLRGLHSRVEKLAGNYQIVSARAFASLADFVRLSASVLAPGGIWMAMKGKHPAEELAALQIEQSAQVEVFHVEQLAVPGLEAQRCIVWMRKITK
jgi:16S rRNA (guanine527-N7)-methyltransferase